MDTLEINKKYSFTTKYPSILGGKFKNMQLEGLDLSYNLAHKYGDVQVMHANIKAIADIHDSIKNLNVSNLTWLVFLNLDTNEHLVIAKEYIDLTSVAGTGDSFTFTISNITDIDVAVIKKALSELGYYTDE